MREDDFPNAGMTYSSALVEFVKQWEGCVLRAYQDAAGVWTVGYGHTGPDVDALAETPSPEITHAEADEYLRQDLDEAAAAVVKLVHVPLTQEQMDALVSFQFNTGALARSTLLRMLNSAQYALAALELTRWVYADGKKLRGLERRRIAEQALFRHSQYDALA